MFCIKIYVGSSFNICSNSYVTFSIGNLVNESCSHCLLSLEFAKFTKLWVQISTNKPKSLSTRQLFYNSYYISLCDATLMACKSWKVVLTH